MQIWSIYLVKKNGVESGFSKRLLGGSEGFNSDMIHLILNETFDAMAWAEKSLTCLSKENCGLASFRKRVLRTYCHTKGGAETSGYCNS